MNKQLLAVSMIGLYGFGCMAQEEPEKKSEPVKKEAQAPAPAKPEPKTKPDKEPEDKSEPVKKEATKAPVSAAPEPQAQSKEESEKTTGIDTVDLDEPQGNWFFKRIWWDRAQTKYESIRAIIDKVFEARVSFFTKRNSIDKQVLDPFYVKIGLGQGEFIEILTSLIAEIEKEREDDGELNEKERVFLEMLEKEKKIVEQLKLDVQAVEKIDEEFDKVLSNVMGQINKVRSYEQEAWSKFKEIANILSDKQARDNYYKIEAIYRNVKDIETYVTQTLASHLDTLVDTAQTQVAKITKTVDGFKQKGVDFKKTADTYEEFGTFTRLEENLERREARKKRVELEDEQDEQTWGQFIYSYTLQPIFTTGYYIGYAVVWPFMKVYGLFFGSEEQEEE